MTNSTDRAWAILVVRVMLGVVFFFGGFFKVFDMGPLVHARNLFVVPYADSYLPVWGLWASGTVIPFVELITGALVLVGLWTRPSLLMLGAILVFVMFGHLVRAPEFVANSFILPRTGLLLVVLLLPREADLFSLDALMARRRSAAPVFA